jgi:hypothetical protein
MIGGGKVKVKLSLCFLTHVSAALLWGMRPRYPLDRRLGGRQSRFGRHGEEKILDPTDTQ